MPVFIDADILRYKAAGSRSQQFGSVIRHMSQTVQAATGASVVAVMTPGNSNKRMRYWWGTTRVYQANRSKSSESSTITPAAMARADDAIRDLLPVIESCDYEADDILFDLAKEGHVISSLDKDLKQAAGRHLSTDDFSLFAITQEQAYLALALQLLTGDKADNVPGLRMGPKTAENMLAGPNPLDKVIAAYSAHPAALLAEQFCLLSLGSDPEGYFIRMFGHDTEYKKEVLQSIRHPPFLEDPDCPPDSWRPSAKNCWKPKAIGAPSAAFR